MILKNSNYLNAAYISDVHLGSSNTPSGHITGNLRKYAFPETPETVALDVIFVAGDLFDKDQKMVDRQNMEIVVWITQFLKFCAKHAIKVISLLGTPSHDWNQMEYMTLINDHANIGCDLTYVDKLSILNHPDLGGINVLYIPDEWKPTTDETWSDVKELLAEKGLEKVDLTVMHGTFGFQLPELGHLDKHREENYLGITKLAVVSGHIHQENQYDRIYIPGSFDRLSHGDEGRKSHLRIKFWKDADGNFDPENMEVSRPENKGAKVYRTITCDNLEVNAAMEKIHRTVKKLPPNSSVRISARSDHPVLRSLMFLRKTYPLLNWTTKTLKDTARPAEVLRGKTKQPKLVQITKDNLQDLTREKVSRLTDDPVVQTRSLELLAGLT